MSETRKIFLDAIEKLSYELEKEKLKNKPYDIRSYCYTKADINNTWNEAIDMAISCIHDKKDRFIISALKR